MADRSIKFYRIEPAGYEMDLTFQKKPRAINPGFERRIAIGIEVWGLPV